MSTTGLHDPFKIVLVGDSNVGKSSFMSRYLNDTHDPAIPATIGATFGKQTVNLDGQRVSLQIWDTSGLERFRSLTPQYLRSAHLVIVVYEVTRQQSFDHVKLWFREIERYAPQDVLKLLVGNKADMVNQRGVAYIVAEEYAKQSNIPFFETSARDGAEVERVFLTAAKLLQERKDQTNAELIKSTHPAPPLTWANVARSFSKKSESAVTPGPPGRSTAPSYTLDGADHAGSHDVSKSEQEVTTKTIRDLESEKNQLELNLRVVHALLEDTISQLFVSSHPLVGEFLNAANQCTSVLAKSVVCRPSDAFLAELEVARKDTVTLIGNSMVAILDQQTHSSVFIAGSKAPSVLVRVVSQSSLINACLNYIIRRTDNTDLSEDAMASIKYTILQKFANVLKVASWAIPDPTSRNTFERSLGSLIEAADRLRLMNSQNPGLLDTSVLAPNFALLSALRAAVAEEVKGEVRQESGLKSLLGFLSPK